MELKKLEVGNLKTAAVVAQPLYPVSKAIGLLKEHDVYEIFVPIGEKVGIITTRKLLGVSDVTMKIESTVEFIPKLALTDTVGKATRIMTEYRLRALPIVKVRELVGEITALSIINEMANTSAGKINAKSLMTANPLTVNCNKSVATARNLMIRKRIDHLPVMDGGRLCGMLTSSHIVSNFIPPEGFERGAFGIEAQRRLETPVKDLMDKNVLTCSLEDSLSTVLGKLLSSKTTYALVKLWDEIQGIITYRDIIKLLAEVSEPPEIPLYIMGLPEDPFEAEVAKSKFIRVISLLRKMFPEILEARSTIKVHTQVKGKERRRYEVNVAIKTPRKRYSYSQTGWELPQIYDMISDRIKRLMADKPGKKRPSLRYGEEPSL